MRLRMWTYDLAREQSPTLDHLRTLFALTRDAGFNAIGLYLEHRFAYPSAPWAAGAGALTKDTVQRLQSEFPDLQIIPFLNLLGHMEGFLYAEQGRRFAEERFSGMQACPSNEEFIEFAGKLLDDALDIFTSEIVHLGGDETQQLGLCARCSFAGERPAARDRQALTDYAAKIAEGGPQGLPDHKARLYGRHFAPLARRVLDAGRRPAVWGDMLLEHPKAAMAMPRETLVFDWQYFRSPDQTTSRLLRDGFEVVCCPSLQTYNSAWLHLDQSERNVKDHIQAAQEQNAYGVCVTTWENALFGSYETLMPALRACGKLMNAAAPSATSAAEPIETGRISFDLAGESDQPVHAQGAVAVKLSGAIVMQALIDGARVVRLEPGTGDLEVRFDQAGGSVLAMTAQRKHQEALLNRMRLLAGMAVDGRRMAQRGAISGTRGTRSFRFDVLSQPSEHGLRLVLTRTDNASADEATAVEEMKDFLLEYKAQSDPYGEWAWLMGVRLPQFGGVFAHSQTRSSLKVRLLLQGNPFLAWLHHGEELSGTIGDQALALCEKAISVAPDAATRGVSGFVKQAVTFVRAAEQARQAYANQLPGVATSALAPARQVFDELEKIARASYVRFGGSQADAERCRKARDHVETVVRRIREYGDGSLGYLPSFEHLTHPKFVPHDQGAWWLINRWANE